MSKNNGERMGRYFLETWCFFLGCLIGFEADVFNEMLLAFYFVAAGWLSLGVFHCWCYKYSETRRKDNE